jgi:hypothetical protein
LLLVELLVALGAGAAVGADCWLEALPAGTVPWIFAFCLLPFVPRAWRVARSLAAFSAFCSAVQCRRRVRSAQQREATALRFSSECSIPFGSVTTRSSAGVRLGAH